MKTLLWQGHRVETADDVAEAAFELAHLLVVFSRTERIDLPAAVAGAPATASLVVGPGMGLGMLSLPGEPERTLPGTDEAVLQLRARIARLDKTPTAGGFRLPDDFTVLDHDITGGPGDVVTG